VRITCDDGSDGIGFCHGGTRSAALSTLAVRELFAARLIGEDPHRTEGLWQELYQDSLLNGRAGAVMRALSAIDNALWDRNARSVGLPLWRYLGAVDKESTAAYASGGYYGPGDPAAVIRSEMEKFVAAGFKAAKMKIGGAEPSVDLLRVAAARDVLGPDRLLMLDANNAWRDLASALRYLDPMMAYHPYMIEEPFGPEDALNHARLAAALPVAIATGEILGGRFASQDMMARGCVTILQPDACVCGGITEWRRIAASAAAMGVSVAPHSLHHLHIHCAASTPNSLFVEVFPDNSIVPFPLVLDRPMDMVDGRLKLPQGPGIGVEFNENAVERFAIDGWA
jgi:L-alanine-DL-glutamate epimerase-like enolase superfamily enzyme